MAHPNPPKCCCLKILFGSATTEGQPLSCQAEIHQVLGSSSITGNNLVGQSNGSRRNQTCSKKEKKSGLTIRSSSKSEKFRLCWNSSLTDGGLGLSRYFGKQIREQAKILRRQRASTLIKESLTKWDDKLRTYRRIRAEGFVDFV